VEPMTVCVTGVGGGGHGSQILKALARAETPYRIVAADITPHSTGLAMAHAAHILPPAKEPGYLDALLELCRREGVKALFHGSEPELKVMSARRREIEALGVFLPLNPPEVIELCMDKLRLSRALADMGVKSPWFRKIKSRDDARGLTRFPLVFKPSVGSGGSANVFMVQNPGEAACFAEHLLGMCDEFIAQEYVGTADDEYTVGVLSDMDGELINCIAVRRYITSALSNRAKAPNLSGRDELGPQLVISNGVSQGEIGRFPEVTRPCQEIARRLGSRGPFNIQCRLVQGEVYVFEINPRFSGTTSLRAMVGFNEPDLLIRRHLLGERIEPGFAYQSGVILRRLEEHFFPLDNGPAAGALDAP